MEPGKDANRRWKQVRGYFFAVLAFVCGWWGGVTWSRRAEDLKATHGISPVGPEAQVEVPATIQPQDRAPLASTVAHDSRPTESALVETPLPLESAKDTDWLARALDVVKDPQLNPEGKSLTNDELLWLAETLQLVNDPPDDLEQLYSKAKQDFAWRLHEQGRSISLPPGVRPPPHAGVGFAFIVEGVSQPIYVNFDPLEDPSTAKYFMATQSRHKSLSEVLTGYFAGL